MAKTQTIEVDGATAATLETRAAECGISVGELVADMAVLQDVAIDLPTEDIAELDRRWMKIEAGERTVPHADVVRWLRTWGTPDFKPWRER